MKKIIKILCGIFLFLAVMAGGILKNTEFITSPDKSYFVAGVCIDIGGAGYIGNYYLVNKTYKIPRIYNTKCNTPGIVIWHSQNEFSINNRNGVYNFIISDDELIAD